jgi:hypothetical protein
MIMRQSLKSIVVGLFLTVSVCAQSQPGIVTSPLAGEWVVTVANYRETVRLTLKIVESSVSGSYNGAPIAGEVKNGQVAFASPTNWAAYRAGKLGGENVPDEYRTVYFARPHENGELVGTADVYLPGTAIVQKMTWSARRAPRQ